MKLTLEWEEDEDTPEGHKHLGLPVQVKVREQWVQVWVLGSIPVGVLDFR